MNKTTQLYCLATLNQSYSTVTVCC